MQQTTGRQPLLSPPSRLSLLLGLLFLCALGLRLWHLGQINALVFDEVYYVKFAQDYRQWQPLYDAHPPLGKYLIALGISLVNPLAIALGLPGNELAGSWLSPWSYRWMNAVVGACLPPLAALLAYDLSRERLRQRLTFAALTGGLLLTDGLTLVESRFGLINIYWAVFGLLGVVALQRSLHTRHPRLWLIVAGIAFGSAINVKWNGAGFLLAMWLLWGLERLRTRSSIPQDLFLLPLRLQQMLLYCGLIPLVTYYLLWLPHLQLLQTSFLAVHQELWRTHQAIAHSPDPPHPYCSAWFTWPLMLRPIAYFYQQGAGQSLTLAADQVVDIHAMGNPSAWWFSIPVLVALLAERLSQILPSPKAKSDRSPIPTVLLVSYAANWLPWMLVDRCTFLYHYMGALIFSQLALAWLLSKWLSHSPHRLSALVVLILIAAGFYFWLPLYQGWPLSLEALQARWWFKSWV